MKLWAKASALVLGWVAVSALIIYLGWYWLPTVLPAP